MMLGITIKTQIKMSPKNEADGTMKKDNKDKSTNKTCKEPFIKYST